MADLPVLVHHAVDDDRALRVARQATGAALAPAPGPLPTLRLRLPRHARPLPGMRHGAVRCRAMRRLLRILLNAATVLSLVLCVVTIAAWVRSYQAHDGVWWSMANPRLELTISTHRGGFAAGGT